MLDEYWFCPAAVYSNYYWTLAWKDVLSAIDCHSAIEYCKLFIIHALIGCTKIVQLGHLGIDYVSLVCEIISARSEIIGNEPVWGLLPWRCQEIYYFHHNCALFVFLVTNERWNKNVCAWIVIVVWTWIVHPCTFFLLFFITWIIMRGKEKTNKCINERMKINKQLCKWMELINVYVHR